MTATKCTAPEYLILVDEKDRQTGIAEKLKAHENNLLHRAFSVFIFRQTDQTEFLLQQRALHKYHSPGLWTNSCCSHPRPGESILDAGQRRLQEELGFAVRLTNLGWFQYNAHFSNGLSEHEIDHVLIGKAASDVCIQPNPNEVHACRWVTLHDLEQELANHPEQFTLWLSQALDVVKPHFLSKQEIHCKAQ